MSPTPNTRSPETQNTNVPAIHFYRSVGFELEGVDLSYYANDDFPDGQIAVFMKKRVEEGGQEPG